MLKKTGFRLLCLVVMVSFLFIAQAQTEEQGWKKTITLPSGEVVCDLNGEWDLLWSGRGGELGGQRVRNVLKITQQGDSFEGIRMLDIQYALPKGSKAIEGELDKDGIKRLIFYATGGNVIQYKGKISKDGNKIEFDDRFGYFELTRK
jgi:hypothetical protein